MQLRPAATSERGKRNSGEMCQVAPPLPPFLLPSQISPPSSSPCSFFSLSLQDHQAAGCGEEQRPAAMSQRQQQQPDAASSQSQASIYESQLRPVAIRRFSSFATRTDNILRRAFRRFETDFNKFFQESSVVLRRAREKRSVSMLHQVSIANHTCWIDVLEPKVFRTQSLNFHEIVTDGEFIHYAECGEEADDITG
ncbi:uncharacterized protein [Solanum lycopersicum]|uniref:uncharacterized protein isoform X3 n=1 Tax=Solanum lycopersicum TaxID=4081 RepID=UPI000532CE43|nr:uncharacterized protein LOC104645037 isoform X2 [Solanum lycopersicum]